MKDVVASPEQDEVDRLLELYRETSYLLSKKEVEEISVAPGFEGLSFQIASVFNLAKKIKQQVLEGRSEKDRVAILSHYFTESLPRLRKMDAAAKRAGANGNIH